jgi:ceramide glucosyltransferase
MLRFAQHDISRGFSSALQEVRLPVLSIELKAFLGFAVLLTAQSLCSLGDGFRFLRSVRASRAKSPADFHPPAAVIIPCKGVFPGFKYNIEKYLTQDYPEYKVIFAVASEDDPARAVLATLIEARQKATTGLAPSREAARAVGASAPGQAARADLVVAGISGERGEKVNNLLAGLKRVGPAAELLVTADADASPGRDWLRSLVGPLADPAVTVSTGFRWYIAGRGFASQLRAAWDTSIATLLGDWKENFAWGGSLAMRAADFRRLDIAGRYWPRTVSDDYGVTRAVREAGGRIHFEPRCLVASGQKTSFGEFLNWANRQIVLTRVYAPRLWRLGLAAHTLYVGTWVFGLGLIALGSLPNAWRAALVAYLLAILALGMAKGGLRTLVAREIFPEESVSGRGAGRAARYWQLQPLVPWVMFWNFLRAGFTREIEWAGTSYRLYADRVEVLGRKGSA